MNLEFASFGVELAQASNEGSTLEGYASVFNYPIDESAGQFERTTFIRPGAFARTIKNNRDQIQVLFNHGLDRRYGQLPIGVIKDLHEDGRGLWARVELHDGPDNENIKAALSSGALRAMSIQFETKDQEFNDERTERYVKEVKLYEFGPVTFPANKAATASLHSLDGISEAMSVNPQSAAPDDEARESTLITARRTWVVATERDLERYAREQNALEGRIKEI